MQAEHTDPATTEIIRNALISAAGEMNASLVRSAYSPIIYEAKDCNPNGDPLDEKAYHAAVEATAGRCGCGGRFTLEASPRCPRCGSASYEEDPDGEHVHFD